MQTGTFNLYPAANEDQTVEPVPDTKGMDERRT
jgi:hypothetical protein